MLIEIFNVRHGQCAVVTAPNGRRIMLDCGTRWDDDDFWTPSLHFFGQRFEYLIPQNLDEDHLTDFGNVLDRCLVQTVMTNLSIGPREFAEMKKAGMRAGAEAYHKWLSRPRLAGGGGVDPDFAGMQVRSYRNSYGVLKKSNDLSVTIFVQLGAFKILFAGDLEGPGWCGLLADPAFVAELAGVTVLVASHHGRENGCHDPLFKHLSPAIVVISDDDKKHGTQETHGYYHWRCHGIPVIDAPGSSRHVFTTRSDGNMRIDVKPDSSWIITTGVKVQSWPTSKKQQNALGGFGLINQSASSLLTDAPFGLGGGLLNQR